MNHAVPHHAGTYPTAGMCPAIAPTPLTLQAQVKKHIQVMLERLLHTVNRRVIVLDRENPLRVSPTAPWLCRFPLGHAGEARGVTALGVWVCVTGSAPRWPCGRYPTGWGWTPGMCPVGCRGKQEPCREQGWSSGNVRGERAGGSGAGKAVLGAMRGLGCILWKTSNWTQ